MTHYCSRRCFAMTKINSVLRTVLGAKTREETCVNALQKLLRSYVGTNPALAARQHKGKWTRWSRQGLPQSCPTPLSCSSLNSPQIADQTFMIKRRISFCLCACCMWAQRINTTQSGVMPLPLLHVHTHTNDGLLYELHKYLGLEFSVVLYSVIFFVSVNQTWHCHT